ncbi:MAG: HAMP domain-containing sensor histidine kinase [Actinomycetota bacterium]
MAADADLSPATAARLRSLRLRVTALIALLATVGVSVFAVAVVRLDRQLRDEQIDTELLRLSDEVGRQVSFADGILEPDDPSLDRIVLAVNPSFSIREFQVQQDLFGFPDPTDEELRDLMDATFFEAELDSQRFLLAETVAAVENEPVAERVDYDALIDDGFVTVDEFEFLDEEDRTDTFDETEFFLDDLVASMIEDPPEDLFDEAYRRYVIEEADEAEVELEFETAFLGEDDAGLARTDIVSITEDITENGRAVIRTTAGTTDDSSQRVVRATPLRDGPEVRGAVIAVLDPTEFDDAHATLRNQVILLALAVVAASVVAAWFVAGRTTRPTGRALAQQERFLADAAHELRTPIAAIRLTAEAADVDSAATSLRRVGELAADASTLTDDLLTLARMDADRMQLDRQRVRIDLLVESIVAAIPDADNAVDVRAPDEVIAPVDPSLVKRAIGNLVRNAMVHGDARPGNTAELTVTTSHASVTVRVRDRGPGLDPDVADDLFERFRSRTGSSGHGLGLPLARWIARAHGGDLTFASTDGPGTTFELTLPLSD